LQIYPQVPGAAGSWREERMKSKRVWLWVFLAVTAVAQDSPHIARWQGSAQIATNGTTFTIPVHLDLETKGSTVVGSFVDVRSERPPRRAS
jgi:hypothetical protein